MNDIRSHTTGVARDTSRRYNISLDVDRTANLVNIDRTLGHVLNGVPTNTDVYILVRGFAHAEDDHSQSIDVSRSSHVDVVVGDRHVSGDVFRTARLVRSGRVPCGANKNRDSKRMSTRTL